MLDRVVERYKKVVVLVTGDIKRYKKATKEIKIAIYLTPLTFVLPLALYHLGILHDKVFLIILGIGTGFSIWIKIVDTITLLQSLRKRLEEELPFFILMAAAVSRTGLEVIELLKFLSKSRIFIAFKELGKRFYGLYEVFGSSEGLSILAKLSSGRVRLFFVEYASALSTGVALQHLRDRAIDYIKSMAIDIDKVLSSRIVVAMIVSIFFSVVPVLLISVSLLFTASIILEEEVISIPTFIQIIAPLIIIASLFTSYMLQGYPLASQVDIDRKILSIYRAMFYIGASTLIAPFMAFHLRFIEIYTFKKYALWGSIIAVALGLLPFTDIIKALSTRVDNIVEEIAHHVRIYRTLHLFDLGKISRLSKKHVKPWLIEYLKEAIEFFRSLGDVDPSMFDLFVMFVFEVERMLRRTLMYLTFMLVAVVLVPILTSATVYLGIGLGEVKVAIEIGYASSLGFGCIAGKVALGKNVSTLLPGIAILLYSTTMMWI